MFRRSDRLKDIPGIGVDRMGDAADAMADPSILRLENLDTDIPPCPEALEETRRAIGADAANSYLPFLGQDRLRRAAAAHVSRQSGVAYDWRRACVISAGGLSGILNVLLATLEQGDEVVLTDPIYAGLLNRVRLAGGVPRLARLTPGADGWRLDLDAFKAAVAGPRVKAVLMMSPSMPTGCVLDAGEWSAVAEACVARDLLLVYDAAMERILFDGRKVLHPAGLPGMAERTVTVGAASKELRMIGWRVGWVVGPDALMGDVGLVGMANVVCQVGIAMGGVAAALEAPEADVAGATAEWQRRRDLLLAELPGFGLIPAHGGWSMLLDCAPLGLTGEHASSLLLSQARIAATPMGGWGSKDTARYLRFVYANEPCERLRGMGERVRESLTATAVPPPPPVQAPGR
jgi:aspartate/methionine/tyrosine aminotransferase